MKSFKSFVILLFVLLFVIFISCKNDSDQMLDPSMFATSEDSSDSSEETEISEIHISGRLMNIDSVSEGIIVHLTYPKTYYPYFKLFIAKEDTNNEIFFSPYVSEEQNDIVLVPVSQNNNYSVTLYLYTSLENYKKNYNIANYETKSIKAVGGSGEYTINTSSTNQKANYDATTKTLTFNTITSSNSVYESRQTFDLYVYTLTPMAPVNGQTDLTQVNIIDKFSNLTPNATNNTYNVSEVLQQYCEDNQSLYFGLLEKLQFRKAGETDYLYEVIYYDTVFSRHEPYTYARNQQAP